MTTPTRQNQTESLRRGRHTAPRRKTRGHVAPRLITVVAIIFLTVGGFIGLTPAPLLPGPHASRSCLVTGGGLFRIDTTDCGILLIRGRVTPMAGERYRIDQWGPFALTLNHEPTQR